MSVLQQHMQGQHLELGENHSHSRGHSHGQHTNTSFAQVLSSTLSAADKF